LLSLATGAGKTFIAVNLLRRLSDAGQLRRALFICDRDELRTQGLGAFQNAFGSDAVAAAAGQPGKNARVIVATYQTLGVDRAEADASFLTKNYPEGYFSHIVIDECHRSAWGKWSEILARNPDAVQIGLTATPREIDTADKSGEADADAKITADNILYFGEPVYEYDMSQGIEDGYLAACEIVQRDIFLDHKKANERETGIKRDDLSGKSLTDARTGMFLTVSSTREQYGATTFEDRLLLPERVEAMARDLFNHLLATGGPEQKTIIFCARDRHCDDVTNALNNLYSTWCAAEGRSRLDAYSFKCTDKSHGGDYLPDLRGGSRHHFIATTVDLLTTGVDVPCVRNIVFFKYVRSPISFYQMVGRGTRIDTPSNKLMFRVYDYTNAIRLFGATFMSKLRVLSEPSTEADPDGLNAPKDPTIRVEGFDVRVTDAGRFIVTMIDGKAMPITAEEYKERLTTKLVEKAPTIEAFRTLWITPAARRAFLEELPDKGRSAHLIRELANMNAFDLYDVLAELGYGLAPRTRAGRAAAFTYKHAAWLSTMPANASATVRALSEQFIEEGTDGLESAEIFQTTEVARAGGLMALKQVGKPGEVLRETKERMFAA
jgi:type I restriction enzyme R subunit